jgi:hypothetical protein
MARSPVLRRLEGIAVPIELGKRENTARYREKFTTHGEKCNRRCAYF